MNYTRNQAGKSLQCDENIASTDSSVFYSSQPKWLFFNFVEKERKKQKRTPMSVCGASSTFKCKATACPYKQVCRPNISLTSLSLTETLHTDMGKTSALSSLKKHYAAQNLTEWCFLVSKANEVFPSF